MTDPHYAHQRPEAEVVAQTSFPPPAARYAPAAPTNGLAVTALILALFGILGCGCVVGLPAAIMGHIAVSRIRQSGEQGDGMAKTAIVLGWIETGLTVALVLATLLGLVSLGGLTANLPR